MEELISKVDRSQRFHEFLGRVFLMGDGGAAPMELEMGEDDARNPTAELVIKSGRRGTKCFEWTCRCCKGKFVGRLRKLAMHIAGEKFAGVKEMNVNIRGV